jgi:membrane protein required for beta-lactamase induction
MRPNPVTDALAFLVATDKLWFTVIFWLLLLGSVAAALQAWRTDPAQRGARHIAIGLLRFIVGCMWWQQSLWKIPPR